MCMTEVMEGDRKGSILITYKKEILHCGSGEALEQVA